MRKNLYIKLSIGLVATLVFVLMIIVKTNSLTLSASNSSLTIKNLALDEIKSQTANNAEVDESESGNYFSVFKFISGFIPSK